MRSSACLVMLLVGRAASGDPAPVTDEAPPRRDAAQVARDGTFLPLSLAARIGDQRVFGLATGGFDTAQSQGATFTSVVEGALYHRVALRVGVDYVPAIDKWSPSIGLRVGILRQERFGIDLGAAALYKNLGFSEAKGEFEFLVMAARRWNRFMLLGNLAYGQGVDPDERDAEVRVAMLYSVIDRVNVGLDVRARFDLGEETPARVANAQESDFDLVAGPLATVAVGPVVFLAQAGVHTLIQHEVPYTGFAALGGVGASF